MKIEKLRLKNFRTFGHLALENIPDLVVLVSPNGLGKSTVLEAIAGTHDLVAPYEGDRYQYEEAIIEDGKPPGRRTPIWPKHLSAPVRVDEESAEVELHVGANSDECRLLSTEDNLTVSATFKITHDRHVIDLKFDRVLPELFRYY